MHLNTVTDKYSIKKFTAAFKTFINADCLRLSDFLKTLVPNIACRKHIVTSCVHYRHNYMLRIRHVICKCLKCSNAHHRFARCVCKCLDSCNAYTKSCKRTRSDSRRKYVNILNVQFKLRQNLFYHCHNLLRMSFFMI